MNSNRKYLVTAISACLLTLVLSIVLVNYTKTSYAIETGTFDDGWPTSQFSTNLDTENIINYVRTAFGTDTTYNNIINNYNVQNHYYDNNNSKPLYKMMKNLKTPASTETFDAAGSNVYNIEDDGLMYVINHGYNTTNDMNNIFTGQQYGNVTDNNIKQYITQIAIWLYIYENKSSFENTFCEYTGNNYDACDFLDTSNNVVQASTVRTAITSASQKSGYNYLRYITQLVDDANTYTGGQDSELTDISENFTYTFSNDNSKIMVNNITPTPSSNEDNYMYYALEIVDPNNYGAYIANSSGTRITDTSKMSGSFSVVVPLANDVTTMNLSSVKVKVYGYFLLDSGKAYIVKTSTSQPEPGLTDNLVIRYGDEKYDRFSQLSFGYSPYEVISMQFGLNNFAKISKVDITNSNELPGATLVLTSEDNPSDTWTWVSTNQPHYISLEDGDYELCETIAPSGYERKTECINFTVDDSHVTAVTMENEPVNVPDTLSRLNKILIALGAILVVVGAAIVAYFAFNNKKETA